MKNQSFPLIVAIAVAAVSAYLLFRTVLEQSDHPITFELFAALIGVSITVMLTSILLRRQTVAELRKEENVMFLDMKMKVYLELIDQLQDIISKKNILEEDLIEIRLLNQKIAFISSQEVLEAFNNFSRCYGTKALKDQIDDDDIDELLLELSKMSFHIRRDLLRDTSHEMENEVKVRAAILQSNDNLDIE
uniref:Uncharacterized protein n=1 Tax=Roseihalotalea indica TaxID=2867963 RepID=A0AA49JG95_9BACT|nr:hypothetical protein K4G66_30960 [Tunicatimonas sp. TK19036]